MAILPTTNFISLKQPIGVYCGKSDQEESNEKENGKKESSKESDKESC